MDKIDSFRGKYFFLSNFYPCVIKHEGISYPSVEHYSVAMKINKDQYIDGKNYTCGDTREYISKLKEPAFAKKFSKKLVIRSDWNSIKLDIMYYGLKEKFKDDNLKEMLLNTNNMELIEGNEHKDTFWGVCGGKGQNNLGKLLMRVRDEHRGKLEKLFK